MSDRNLTGEIVTIVAIFDKHEDFIKLQYESISKYVDCEYDYIIFNNASDETQRIANRSACETLGIKCIDVHVNYKAAPSNIAGEALNQAFTHLTDKIVFKIDSDMFFNSNINLLKLFEEGELLFIPNYHNGEEQMWSGVFGLNQKQVKDTINFSPGAIPQTDTFGQSMLLVSNPNYRSKRFELFNLQNIVDGVYTTNYNTVCLVHLNSSGIISIEKDNYIDPDTLHNLPKRYKEISDICEINDFPTPYNIDMITLDGVNFMIHFKSSNWCPWYTETYIDSKKIALNNYFKNLP